MRFIAEVQGREYEVDADLAESVEVLRNQVFSLVETNIDGMDLVLEGFGLLSDDVDLSRISITSNRLSLRRKVDQLPADWSESCSRLFVDSDFLQPAYRFGEIHVCVGCATLCRSGMASEIDINKEPFRCQCLEREDCLFNCRREEWYPLWAQLQVKKKLEADCKKLWKNYFSTGLDEFSLRIRSNKDIVQLYENPELQETARQIIPKVALETRQRAEADTSHFKGRDAYVEQLLGWFKQDFFTWTDAPKCKECGLNTVNAGSVAPTSEEKTYMANHVELYRCQMGHETRFPRYNHPGKLLQTRTGRCGEWAICFGLILRASGYDTRIVLDFTDHVWNEIWSEEQSRWLHCDSCEAKLDSPLLYEQGWGKKLTYIFAESKHGIRDVIRRYTKDLEEVKKRRIQVPEPWIPIYIADANKRIRGSLPADVFEQLKARDKKEDLDLGLIKEISPSETQPRESGNLAWRQARGEMGQTQPEEVKQLPPTTEPKPEPKSEPKPDPKEEEKKEVETLPQQPPPATASTQPVSPANPQAGNPKEVFKRKVEAAFKQMTVGCGKATCQNEHCASSGKILKLSPSEAAAKAVQLLSQGKFHQCEE